MADLPWRRGVEVAPVQMSSSDHSLLKATRTYTLPTLDQKRAQARHDRVRARAREMCG